MEGRADSDLRTVGRALLVSAVRLKRSTYFVGDSPCQKTNSRRAVEPEREMSGVLIHSFVETDIQNVAIPEIPLSALRCRDHR